MLAQPDGVAWMLRVVPRSLPTHPRYWLGRRGQPSLVSMLACASSTPRGIPLRAGRSTVGSFAGDQRVDGPEQIPRCKRPGYRGSPVSRRPDVAVRHEDDWHRRGHGFQENRVHRRVEDRDTGARAGQPEQRIVAPEDQRDIPSGSQDAHVERACQDVGRDDRNRQRGATGHDPFRRLRSRAMMWRSNGARVGHAAGPGRGAPAARACAAPYDAPSRHRPSPWTSAPFLAESTAQRRRRRSWAVRTSRAATPECRAEAVVAVLHAFQGVAPRRLAGARDRRLNAPRPRFRLACAGHPLACGSVGRHARCARTHDAMGEGDGVLVVGESHVPGWSGPPPGWRAKRAGHRASSARCVGTPAMLACSRAAPVARATRCWIAAAPCLGSGAGRATGSVGEPAASGRHGGRERDAGWMVEGAATGGRAGWRATSGTARALRRNGWGVACLVDQVGRQGRGSMARRSEPRRVTSALLRRGWVLSIRRAAGEPCAPRPRRVHPRVRFARYNPVSPRHQARPW